MDTGIKAYVRLSRPFTLLAPALGMVSAAVAGLGIFMSLLPISFSTYLTADIRTNRRALTTDNRSADAKTNLAV